MSDIKTAVLEINTGGAITNIKEFKQHIEDLKGKLLALEKGTEEYSAVASELRSSQEKLNEVMDVAKGRGEAVAGSYDNLVATMRELKKEWRATGDAVERQKLGEQILTINNQLKELDASTGNFQRNVGDYSNAFEKAFDKVLGGIAGSDSVLAKLAGNIKNLIPVIKSVNQVATAGLKGIKAAIASTGIGLLVVALGEIVAHWSDITNWIGKATGLQKDYTKEIEKTRKETQQIKDDFKKLTDQENIMYLRLELEGVSKLDALNEKFKIITDKSFNAIHSLDSTITNTGTRILWFKDKVLKDFGFSKEQIEYLNKYREGLGITSDELVDLSRSEKKNKELLEAKAQQIQQVIDIYLAYNESLRKTQLEVEQEKINEEKRARDLKKTSEEALMSESALLTKRYKENKALMEKYHIDTTALTRKYYKDLRDIAIKNKVNIEDVIFTSKSGDFDKIKNEIKKFYDDISNYNTSIAVKNYNENLSLLNKQLDEGTISYTDYLDNLRELSSTYSKEVSIEHYQFKRNALEKEYNDNKVNLTKAEKDELKQLQNIADKRKKELDGYLKDRKISTEEYQKETKKVEDGLLTARTEVHNRYIDTKKKLDAKYLAETKKLTVDEAKETASLALNAINIEFDRKLNQLNLSKRLQDSIKNLPAAVSGLKGLFGEFKINPDIFSSSEIKKQLKEVLDYNNQVLDTIKKKNETIIQENELLLKTLPNGSKEALDALKAINDAKAEIQKAEKNSVVNIDKELQKILNYNNLILKIAKKKNEEIIKQNELLLKSLPEGSQEALNALKAISTAKSEIQKIESEGVVNIDEEFQKILNYNNQILEITRKKNEAIIQENELLLETLPKGSQEALNAMNVISAAKAEIQKAEKDSVLNIDKELQKILNYNNQILENTRKKNEEIIKENELLLETLPKGSQEALNALKAINDAKAELQKIESESVVNIDEEFQKILDYNNQILETTRKRNEEIIKQNELLLKSLPEGSQEALNAMNAISAAKAELQKIESEGVVNIDSDIKKNLQLILDYNNQILENTRKRNEKIIQENELLLKSLPEGSQEALDAMNAISAARIEIENAVRENVIANTKAEDEAEEQLAERRKKRVQIYIESVQDSVNKLPNAIGGLKGLFSDFKANPDIFSFADIEKNLQEVLDYNNQVLEITRERNEEIIEQNELLLQSLPEGSQEALDAMNAISAAKMEIQNAETENLISNTEAQDEAEEQLAERRNKRVQMYSDGLKSIGSILDMVAQQQQKEIQDEVKDGKISEEQAKQRFEDTKKLQIASAIINMAAGVVSAISAAQQLGPIAGPIAAAVNAAAVITAGVIQIANINKTKFGSTSVGSTTTPNVAEVSNDYTPQYTQNVTTDSELTELSNAINNKPLYVSVTDIDSVQDTVRTRENEATY